MIGNAFKCILVPRLFDFLMLSSSKHESYNTPIQRCTQFCNTMSMLLDFSLTVKAATLIFISGRGSAISSAKKGKSGFIYNLVKG